MKTLSDVLATKGAEVFSIGPNDNVYDAVSKMNEKGVGSLVVVADGDVVGIVSERDVARKITLTGKPPAETRSAEIMSAPVTCVSPKLAIHEAMQIMTDMRVRHLPVVDGPKILGVVSIGDLVKAIIDDQKFTIEQLQQYITS